MKKIALISLLTLSFSIIHAQNVGIGTSTPNGALEIISSNEGIIIPRVALTSTTDVTTIPNRTISEFVYNSATISDVTPGFYYWDGGKWVKLLSSANPIAVDNGLNYDATSETIQLGGPLVENTTITQDAFTMDFTTTATDGFSVDGTTFSVDGANNRIGIGTDVPTYDLDVDGDIRATGKYYGHIYIDDTRDIDDAPTAFDWEVAFDFKRRTTVGVPGSGIYSGMMTLAPWQNNGGDASHQINFNEGGLYWRQGQPDAAAWGNWNEILTTNNGISAGNGTTNYLARWTPDNTTLGIGVTYDDGTNVGIGTSSPAAKLHVDGSTRITDLAGVGNKIVIADIDGDLATVADGSADQILQTDGAGNLTWVDATDSDHDWYDEANPGNAPTDILDNIYTFGNVGIGANNPSSTLDVVGTFQLDNSASTGAVLISDDAVGNTSWSNNIANAVDVNNGLNYDATAEKIQLGGALVENTTIAQGAFTMDFTTSATDGFSVDGTTFSVDGQNDRIGIGTTIPTGKFSVYSGGGRNDITLQTSDNTASQGIAFQNSGAAYTWNIYRKDIGSNRANLVFANGADSDISALTDVVTFENDGNVGIGDTDPSVKLNAVGRIRASAADNESELLEIRHDGSNASLNYTGDGNLDFRRAGTNGFAMESDGDLIMESSNSIKMINNFAVINDGSTYTLDANALSGWQTVGSYSTWMTVETDNVVTISLMARFRIVGGSGDDNYTFRIYIDGDSGCSDGEATAGNTGLLQDYTEFRNDFMPITVIGYDVPNCNGRIRFALQVNVDDSDDDISFDDIAAHATKF